MKDEGLLLKTIAVISEITGTNLSKSALIWIEQELKNYPEKVAFSALRKAGRECLPGRFCLAEVLKRIDDGRPTADEAWALVPQNEETTVVWNNEICEAWGVAKDLIVGGDNIAARMTFKAAYDRIVERNKDAGIKPNWWPSLGHDSAGRENVIRQAVEQGRLTASQYQEYLPPPEINDFKQIDFKKTDNLKIEIGKRFEIAKS